MYVFSLLLFISAEMCKHNPFITVFARFFVEVVSGSEGLCVCAPGRGLVLVRVRWVYIGAWAPLWGGVSAIKESNQKA